MALILEQIHTDGIAQLSYLLGDDDSRTAAVIDPRTDVEVYVELAGKHELAITHIFETHIHADYVSGSRELASRCPLALMYLSVEGGAGYGFEQQPLCDGNSFTFGSTLLTARHTPGHTPEHVSFIGAHKDRAQQPWAVFSGDALFVNSVGRPDLLGQEHADHLADQLHHTLYDFFVKLDDAVIVYPGHGRGSPCGASIGDRPSSTIGYERRFNPFLQLAECSQFKQRIAATNPPEPAYYRRMKKINAAGPPVLGHLPIAPPLTPARFQSALQRGDATLLDTRSMLSFGGGHIPGALNIGNLPMLSVWAGWMLDPEKPLLLVLEEDRDLDAVIPLLLRVGVTRFSGYLLGGMRAWSNAALPMLQLRQMTVHELKVAKNIQILDVRSPAEWCKGHIPGARHLFVPDIPRNLQQFKADQPIATYCGSGYRASIAASILQAHGFKDVRNVPGSWSAWKQAGYPVEQ